MPQEQRQEQCQVDLHVLGAQPIAQSLQRLTDANLVELQTFEPPVLGWQQCQTLGTVRTNVLDTGLVQRRACRVSSSVRAEARCGCPGNASTCDRQRDGSVVRCRLIGASDSVGAEQHAAVVDITVHLFAVRQGDLGEIFRDLDAGFGLGQCEFVHAFECTIRAASHHRVYRRFTHYPSGTQTLCI